MHEKLRVSTEINNTLASSMVWSNNMHSLTTKKSTSNENLSKRMSEKIIGHVSFAGHYMDIMLDLLTSDGSNSSIT